MTIKNATNEKARIRAIAKAKIDEFMLMIEQVKEWRDEECDKQDEIIAAIRAKREAKAKANAKANAAKDKAKQDMEDRLKQQAYAAAAKKAKEAAAAAHPDHGGTCDGFRAAYGIWKDLEALAKG